MRIFASIIGIPEMQQLRLIFFTMWTLFWMAETGRIVRFQPIVRFQKCSFLHLLSYLYKCIMNPGKNYQIAKRTLAFWLIIITSINVDLQSYSIYQEIKYIGLFSTFISIKIYNCYMKQLTKNSRYGAQKYNIWHRLNSE